MTPAFQHKTLLTRVVGMVAYLAVGVLYFGSGLVVPQSAAYGLWAMWILGLLPTTAAAVRRPLWVLSAAPIALVFWVGFVQIGSWLFGWTA